MKISLHTLALIASAALLAPTSGSATLVVLHEYRLGETGTIVGGLPQDSAGTAHFANGTFNTTSSTGVTAPGSTDYALTGFGFNAQLAATVPADNFAIELWVQSANPATTSTIMASAGGASTLSFRLVQDGGNFVGSIGDGTNILGTQTATSDWTHLALIRHDGVASFYVNGLAVGTTNTTVPVRNSLHIGVKPGGGGTLAGGSALDELRIFSFDSSDDPVSFLNVSVIPEPATGALFALALASLVTLRRHLS